MFSTSKTHIVVNILLLLVIVMALPDLASSQEADSTALNNTDISILTCRSGDELYSTFGHTAVRINNAQMDTDVVYNYGVFSFDTPGFYVKSTIVFSIHIIKLFGVGFLVFYMDQGNNTKCRQYCFHGLVLGFFLSNPNDNGHHRCD